MVHQQVSKRNGAHECAAGLSRKPERGLFAWALYDWANSAFATVIQTFIFAAYFARRVAPDSTVGSSRWGLAVGSAGLIVAVLGPILGAMADQKGRRKPWLGAFALLAVVATGLLWFIEPETSDMVPAMFLVGLAVIGFEISGVFFQRDAAVSGQS